MRGLFLEATRRNDTDAARALAEQAVKRDPRLAWGVNALFDMQARAGDYEGALDTLAIARQNGHVDQSVSLRRRAVLLTAEARELEGSNPDKALTLASEALRLAPSLVPAAEIAGRILASKGESRQASRLDRADLEAVAASRPRSGLCLRQARRAAARAGEAGQAAGEPHAGRRRRPDRHRQRGDRGA